MSLIPSLGSIAGSHEDILVKGPKALKKPHLTSSTDSRHYKTNHTPYQGDNGQQTLKKDVAGIHTKTSSHTKNTELTQSTQGCSHIKTPLQDHSR